MILAPVPCTSLFADAHGSSVVDDEDRLAIHGDDLRMPRRSDNACDSHDGGSHISAEDDCQLLQPEWGRLLRRPQPQQPRHPPDHDCRPLLHSLHALRHASTARQRAGARPEVWVVSSLPADRVDVGFVRELRTPIRGAARQPVRAASWSVSGQLEAGMFTLHARGTASQCRWDAVWPLAQFPVATLVGHLARRSNCAPLSSALLPASVPTA